MYMYLVASGLVTRARLLAITTHVTYADAAGCVRYSDGQNLTLVAMSPCVKGHRVRDDQVENQPYSVGTTLFMESVCFRPWMSVAVAILNLELYTVKR